MWVWACAHVCLSLSHGCTHTCAHTEVWNSSLENHKVMVPWRLTFNPSCRQNPMSHRKSCAHCSSGSVTSALLLAAHSLKHHSSTLQAQWQGPRQPVQDPILEGHLLWKPFFYLFVHRRRKCPTCPLVDTCHVAAPGSKWEAGRGHICRYRKKSSLRGV